MAAEQHGNGDSYKQILNRMDGTLRRSLQRRYNKVNTCSGNKIGILHSTLVLLVLLDRETQLDAK